MTQYVVTTRDGKAKIKEDLEGARWYANHYEQWRPHIYELGPEVKEPTTIVFQGDTLNALLKIMRGAGIEIYQPLLRSNEPVNVLCQHEPRTDNSDDS